MKKHLTRFYLGLAILIIIACFVGIIYGIWHVLLLFPIVSMWVGIAGVVLVSYGIGSMVDESAGI